VKSLSHVTTVQVAIKDVQALADATKELGGTLHLGKTRWTNYQGSGECAHAISLPGASYEVGVIKQSDGTFRLGFDFYRNPALESAFGKNCGKLTQYYAKHATTREFRKRGYSVSALPSKDGSLRLSVSKGA
jgi:hypothetical protein